MEDLMSELIVGIVCFCAGVGAREIGSAIMTRWSTWKENRRCSDPRRRVSGSSSAT